MKWLFSDILNTYLTQLQNGQSQFIYPDPTMALATKSYFLYNGGFFQYSLLFSRMDPMLSLLNIAMLSIMNFLAIKRKKQKPENRKRCLTSL